jgi:hypothetical protein
VNIGERVMYMVTGWLPEKSGAARQRLRESEAEQTDTSASAAHADPTVLDPFESDGFEPGPETDA